MGRHTEPPGWMQKEANNLFDEACICSPSAKRFGSSLEGRLMNVSVIRDRWISAGFIVAFNIPPEQAAKMDANDRLLKRLDL
jgi:hypothetical protein